MELTIGIILLVTYAVMIVLAVKGSNMTFLLFGMAVVWSILAMIGGELTWTDFGSVVIGGGATSYGATIVTIIFGSWFGRVLVDTNIVGTIIRKTAELGGDKAGVTLVLLCLVTSVIFTSIYGVGVVIAIGLIVLPILYSLGIPKKLATVAYVMSVAAPMYINVVLQNSIVGLFPEYDISSSQYRIFGFIAYGVHIVITVIMALIILKVSNRKKVHAWAVESGDTSAATVKKVPGISMIMPIIPVLLVFFFEMDIVLALIISILLALIITGSFKDIKAGGRMIMKTFSDALNDIALFWSRR